MNQQLLADGFVVFLRVGAPVLGAAAAGAAVAGLVRAATKVEDRSLSLAGKLAAVALLLYLMAGKLGSEIIEFTRVVWSSNQSYF